MKWREPVARGLLLLMETLWVYALVFLVVSLADGPETPSLVGVGLIVGLSYTISRLLQSSDLELNIIRIWGVVASLLLFYLIVRIDFFGDWRIWDFTWADRLAGGLTATVDAHPRAFLGIPVLWLIWMRGVARGQDPLMFEAVVSSFATGIVVIVVIQLLANAVDAPRTIGYVGVPYIALGLIAIGLTHAARSESEYGRSISGSWLLAIGAAVGVLSLIAFFFVLIDLGTIREAIAFVATWIGRALFFVFYVVVYVIATIVEFVVRGFLSILGLSADNARPELNEAEPLPEREVSPASLPGWALWIGRSVAGMGVLGLALAALYFTFARFQKRKTPGTLKESTYTEGRLGADLGNFLGSVLGRLRPNLSFGEQEPVRRLYRDMLNEAAHRGIHRGDSQTPLELAPALDSAFGSRVPDRITDMFDDVRYGGLHPPAEEVRRLREEWDRSRHGQGGRPQPDNPR